MRVFVGFGYNDRDRWIEDHVFPILRHLEFTVLDGKDLHGQILQPGVKSRIEQSDVAIGFFTIRDGQGDADFNSHIWVRDEMMHAVDSGKPIILVKEEGANVPDGLLGNRQYIPLRQEDRLACVVELVGALARRGIRRLKLAPADDRLRRNLQQWRRTAGFLVRYRTKDAADLESPYREGCLDVVDQGFYLNVCEVPQRGFVEVQGVLNGVTRFDSGWASADAVQVEIS